MGRLPFCSSSFKKHNSCKACFGIQLRQNIFAIQNLIIMKRFKKIAKWTGFILLFIIVALTALTATRQDLRFEAPYPNIKASTDSTVIAQGKHLVYTMAHCADCHSNQNNDSLAQLGIEPTLSGGYKFEFELGTFYSRNITSDEETGIGKLTDAEIARTLYYGVNSKGQAMIDFMPFHNVSEEDMTAIISYIRTLKPVKNNVPENEYSTLGKVLKAFLVKPVGPKGSIPKTIKADTSAVYGGYIVNSVANCAGCHTMRGGTGEYIGEPLAGGNAFVEPGLDTLTPPNLTPHPDSRIYGWSKKNFIDRVRMGKLIKHSHMPRNSYKKMTDDELTAIYNYLQSVKPAKTSVEEK